MRKKYEIVNCDICKEETKNESMELNVIFTTEQNEGRSCKPYFSKQNIDICDNCLSIIYNGKQLFGQGAMGCNNYYFLKENRNGNKE